MIEPEHRRAILTETIVSTAINSLVPAVIIWCVAVHPPETLLGAHGLYDPMAKASGIGTLAMTIVITLLIRARVRKGSLAALAWSPQDSGVLRWMPQNLLLRAIACAGMAIVLLVPAGLAVFAMLDILPLTRVGFLLFNLGFGAVVGIVMTRFVVLRALMDRRAP